MELFTKQPDEDYGGIVRWDGWIDLPQKLGRVRLNSEYIADSESAIYMPGVKIPLVGAEQLMVGPTEEIKQETFDSNQSDDEMVDQTTTNQVGG